MSSPERLQDYLTRYTKRYPFAWKQYQTIIDARGNQIADWPKWCWCPMAAASSVIRKSDAPEKNNSAEIGILSALAAWRMTQGIYRFDPRVFATLWETPLEGKIPVDVLYHLPEWCIYIEAHPGHFWMGSELLGWFANMEWDIRTGRTELSLVFDTVDGLFPFSVLLVRPTLKECLAAYLDETQEQIDLHQIDIPFTFQALLPVVEKVLIPVVSVVLYIGCLNADIMHYKNETKVPKNPQRIKTKTGMRYFPADQQNVWNVGYRIGALLRKASSAEDSFGARSGTHAAPRPHIRKAHWHSYWTGSKKDISSRRVILNWIPPVTVGMDKENIIPTIYPVND